MECSPLCCWIPAIIASLLLVMLLGSLRYILVGDLMVTSTGYIKKFEIIGDEKLYSLRPSQFFTFGLGTEVKKYV